MHRCRKRPSVFDMRELSSQLSDCQPAHFTTEIVKPKIILMVIMSDDPNFVEQGELSPAISVRSHDDPTDVGDTPKKKRHVIKAKNFKSTPADGSVRSSPFAKGIDFIGKLSKSKKSKAKSKKEPSLSHQPDSAYSSDAATKSGDQGINVATVSEKPSDETVSSEKSLKQPDTNPSAPKKTQGEKKKKISMVNKSEKKVGKTGKTTGKKDVKDSVKSHVLTDYYPVRRSGRKTKSCLEKEQNDFILQAIDSKYEDGLSVVDFEGKGRGVVAKRAFKKGTFIVEYAGDLINWTEAKRREQQYSLDPSVGCYMYYFIYNNTNYCVDATAESGRLGRLLNHSRRSPNCRTKLVPVPDAEGEGTRPRLVIVAKQDISAGEELTYDYGDRDKETLQSHPWLKST